MDKYLSIPADKKVVRVRFPNLQEKGFGWDGSFTREAWRKACLDNFITGKDQFEQWQAGWEDRIDINLPKVSLAATLSYDDRASETILNTSYQAVLLATLDFVAHIFESDVDAANFVFSGSADFRSATFRGNADFSSATFRGNADFSSVTFSGFAGFNSATFSGDAYFSSATFSGDAYFSSATLSGDAYFFNATFIGSADFSSATLSRDAYFISATFSGSAYFRRTIFHRQCRFDNTFNNAKNEWTPESSFTGNADFENAIFKNVGHFERTRFKNHTPTFRGCQIDSTRLEFSDDSYFPRDESSEKAVKNISFLKRLADEHGQTDQALNFNAMELRAKRLQTEPKPASLSFKVVTWLYGHVSDFGRSFTKPLKYYFILLGVVFLLALGNAIYFSPTDCNKEKLRALSDLWRDDTPCNISESKPDDKIRLNGYRAAAEYTVYRAAGILDFSDNGKATDAVARRLFGQSYEPGWMRFIGLIKAVASTALLFLAALGLRNKYRIK